MKGFRLFRTIQVKLIIMYVLLILFAMQLIGIYFMKTMESSFMTKFSEDLNAQAAQLSFFVVSFLSPTNKGAVDTGTPEGEGPLTLDKFVATYKQISNADIQVLDANGTVLTTTLPNSTALVGQKNTQDVVTRALQNVKDPNNSRILIDPQGKRSKVVAMPVDDDSGKVIGAVYLISSIEGTYATINRINGIFISGTLIALAMTALLGVILSSTITSPVKEITKQVATVAEGRINQRVRIYGQDEIGQLAYAFNNMTERLQEALSANEEEKEKLASILTNMSDGVIATDDNGTAIVVNRRAREMLGLGEEEAPGRSLAELLGLRELSGRASRDREYTTLVEIGEPDEEPRKVRVAFTPIHRREIGTTGTIVVLQDVTEQEELERSRREFVANVSHELRTPLTTIKSYLEALEDGALEEPQLAQRFLGVTRGETERMIRLVTDLLNLSRFDSKQATLAMEPTHVAEMLDEVADRFSFQLEQKHIAIRVELDRRMPPFLMDRDKIDQVLDNLVSNSIKYTADGGRIGLTAKLRSSGGLEISVEDNGIGIPKKDLSRIFERFYRVDKARSRNMGGTGLGLAIAREIIKAHGGTIALESEYNSGTKVTFTLPVPPEGSVQA